MKKFLKVIIPVIIISLIAFIVVKKIKKTKKNILATPTPQIPFYLLKGAKVKKGEILEKYYYLGKIAPDKTITISSKISGIIEKLYVKEGDIVNKGELLLKIDDKPIKLEIENLKSEKKAIFFEIKSLKADLDSAYADLKFKKDKYLRDKALFYGKAISKEKFQQSETLYKIAKNKVKKLKESINSLKEKIKSIDKKIAINTHNLKYTEIVSPSSGKVTKIYLYEGSFLLSGKPVFNIESTENYKILIDIPSTVAEKLSRDSYILASINNKKEKLAISKIYPSSPDNSLVRVEVRVPKLPDNIPTGSFINVILVAKKLKGFIVPVNSIVSMTDGDYVLTQYGKKIERIKVSTLFCDESNCIVKGNLKENQIIATGMENKLRLVYFRQNGEIRF